jgi:hypothetical protein
MIDIDAFEERKTAVLPHLDERQRRLCNCSGRPCCG